jgi:hypothetical protein
VEALPAMSECKIAYPVVGEFGYPCLSSAMQVAMKDNHDQVFRAVDESFSGLERSQRRF